MTANTTRRVLLPSLLGLLALTGLGGCFGGHIEPGEGEFWWDDQNKVRIDDYRLPAEADEPEPDREGGKASPIMTEPERRRQPEPRTEPERESTATVIPMGTR